MNTRFILPGMVALTAHAFLLFGLTGKTLPAMIEPATKPVETEPALSVDQDDPETDPARTDEELPSKQSGPVVPYPGDMPVVDLPHDAITVPPRPAVKGDRGITVIPAGWENPPGPGRNSLSDAVGLDRLDRIPRTRSQPAPLYPADLRRHGIEGAVVVEFLVDKEGNVHNPVVLRASNPEFIEPALDAVARWKFEPGYSGGRKVRFHMSIPLVFKIDGMDNAG